MFSIVKVARDQTQPGSLLARLNGLLDERHWERGCYWYGNCSFILSESRVEFGPRYSVVLNRRITHFKKLNVSQYQNYCLLRLLSRKKYHSITSQNEHITLFSDANVPIRFRARAQFNSPRLLGLYPSQNVSLAIPQMHLRISKHREHKFSPQLTLLIHSIHSNSF